MIQKNKESMIFIFAASMFIGAAIFLISDQSELKNPTSKLSKKDIRCRMEFSGYTKTKVFQKNRIRVSLSSNDLCQPKNEIPAELNEIEFKVGLNSQSELASLFTAKKGKFFPDKNKYIVWGDIRTNYSKFKKSEYFVVDLKKGIMSTSNGLNVPF